MSLPVMLSATDLSALLCSRICHDIISPVSAINNGLELLEENGHDEDVMNLIKTSAHNASARLQFARLAFGAAGSASVQMNIDDAQTVANGYMKAEKAEISWIGSRILLSKDKIKLLLNLLLIANAAIPRGGSLSVIVKHNDNDELHFALIAKGPTLRVPPKFLEFHSGKALEEPIDAHSVQPYYTLLLAKQAGMTISIHTTAEELIFSAA